MNNLVTASGTDSHSSRVCKICGRDVPAIEIEVLGRKRWVQPVCKCEADAQKAEIARITGATYESEMRSLFSISDIGRKYMFAKFEDFEVRAGAENAYKASKYYAENFDEFGAESLILWGDPGNGKTHLAAAVHNKLSQDGLTVVFVSMPDLLSKIKASFNRNNAETEEQIMKALIKCDLLIIDDLGAEKTSDWVQEKVFEIVDGRYRRQKPIMATSNLNLRDLADHIGKRACDRLTEMSQPIENKATSYRREIAKQRISKFDEILNK